VNLVPAKVLEVTDDGVTVALGSQRGRFGAPKSHARRGPGGEALPSAGELHDRLPNANANGGRGIELSGTIVRRASGDTMRYWVKVDDREWIVDSQTQAAVRTLDGRFPAVPSPSTASTSSPSRATLGHLTGVVFDRCFPKERRRPFRAALHRGSRQDAPSEFHGRPVVSRSSIRATSLRSAPIS